VNLAVLAISILLMLVGGPLAGAAEVVDVAEVAEAADESIDLASHRGEVVVVDFWASWCKPCRAELPWLASMQARHGAEGLTVLTVNVDRERADADKLLAALGVTLPVIHDPDGKLAEAHELEGMPTSLVYDRDGMLRATRVGFVPEDEAEFEDLLIDLLKGSGNDAQKS
jgi:thiol-disulfide isomerase/thioredoxin